MAKRKTRKEMNWLLLEQRIRETLLEQRIRETLLKFKENTVSGDEALKEISDVIGDLTGRGHPLG